MKTVCTLLLACILCFSKAIGQASHTIGGTVKNQQNEVLAGASIHVMKAGDSALVKTLAAEPSGRFSVVGLNAGMYLLAITAVGYKKYISNALTLDSQHANIQLPVIILVSKQGSDLQQVVVTAKKPLIEQAIDRTIVNVDAMITAAGSNALEVLSKTPGVTVENESNIKLQGSGGVMVLIDGRSTYMSGQDLAAYLKSLPGSLLDKIELITSPPARYDANGNAIINIKLKKVKLQGLAGSISAGYSQGVYARHNESVNINYRRNKVNVSGNISYVNERDYVKDDYDRLFYNQNGAEASSVILGNWQRIDNEGINGRLVFDYAANDKTTYGFIGSINRNPRQAHLNYISNSLNAIKQLDSTGKGTVDGDSKRTNRALNANMLHRFNTAGRELSAEINYMNYSGYSTQDMMNAMFEPAGTSTNQNRFVFIVPSDINIVTANADYVHPLPGKALLEAGIKSSLVKNDNQSDFFDIKTGGQQQDFSKSNHFVYKENINAAYVSFQKDFGRFGGKVGLRAENTNASGHQLGNHVVEESQFSRHYTSLFPSINVRYKLDSAGKNSLVFSLSRRINRPNYQQLNPFISYQDNYSYSTGNPLLKPQYQQRVEMRYQHKSLLNITFSYSHFTDVIFNTTNTQGNLFISQPNNVANGYMLRLATNLNVSPTKWWLSSTNLLFGHLAINGDAYGLPLQPVTNVVRLDVFNQFTFKKGWQGELTGYYASRDLNGQYFTKARFTVNAAIQKKILKDKGSVRLIFSDVFHSWIQRNWSMPLRGASATHVNESDTQRMGISFTYSFSKGSLIKKRGRSSNADDSEKDRVN